MLGENIRYYREKKKMTQEQLAQQLFVTKQTVSRWENNQRLPDLKMIQAIAKEFHLSVDTLINENEETKGTSLFYYKLNYQQRYDRTLKMGILMVVILIIDCLILQNLMESIFLASFFSIVWGVQLSYNYYKWKK